MGGMGSGGHWYWGAKDTTDDYRSIDVRRWSAHSASVFRRAVVTSR